MPDIDSIDKIEIDDVDSVDSYAKDGITSINGYTTPQPLENSLALYNFENQTVNENGSSDWNPSAGASGTSHIGWETDTACVTGGGNWGNPAGNSNTITDGWNLGQGTTNSGGTGPNGGVHSNLDGTHDSSGKYMYVEGTGVKDDRVCVARMTGMNFSTAMSDTSLNLNLKFWLHQYSSNNSGHNLYIYIDDASTSTLADATLLSTITDFSAFSANSSNWVQQTVSLNSYRTTDSTFYIYFVADGATSFRCDIAIDNVEFSEGG